MYLLIVLSPNQYRQKQPMHEHTCLLEGASASDYPKRWYADSMCSIQQSQGALGWTIVKEKEYEQLFDGSWTQVM